MHCSFAAWKITRTHYLGSSKFTTCLSRQTKQKLTKRKQTSKTSDIINQVTTMCIVIILLSKNSIIFITAADARAGVTKSNQRPSIYYTVKWKNLTKLHRHQTALGRLIRPDCIRLNVIIIKYSLRLLTYIMISLIFAAHIYHIRTPRNRWL